MWHQGGDGVRAAGELQAPRGTNGLIARKLAIGRLTANSAMPARCRAARAAATQSSRRRALR